MKRVHMTDRKKREIGCLQKWRCNMCKELLPWSYQIDHILPIFLGPFISSNEMWNLQALCPNCHSMKSALEAARDYEPNIRSPYFIPGHPKYLCYNKCSIRNTYS